MELSWRDRIGDVSYSISGNMSTLRNRVISLYDDIDRISGSEGGVSGSNNLVSSAFEQGHSIWYFRAYDYVGVDKETGAPQFRNAAGEIVISSELKTTDMTDIGSAIPRLTYGITLNVAWKGLDLTVFGTGVAGNKIYNVLYRADTPMRNSLRYYMENAWTPRQPQRLNARHGYCGSGPQLLGIKCINVQRCLLQDQADSARLHPARQAYEKGLREEPPLLRFTRRLLHIHQVSRMDPETATTSSSSGAGYDIGSYPTMKKVTFGATIGF